MHKSFLWHLLGALLTHQEAFNQLSITRHDPCFCVHVHLLYRITTLAIHFTFWKHNVLPTTYMLSFCNRVQRYGSVCNGHCHVVSIISKPIPKGYVRTCNCKASHCCVYCKTQMYVYQIFNIGIYEHI